MPRTYTSTDTNAPVLNGAVNSAAALLKAVLVDGYGSQPAAGWSAPFSGTNKLVLRQGAGNQHYVRLDDSNALTMRWQAYETMTDVDTGAVPTPTPGQMSGGLYLVKSSSADSVARPWIVIADSRSFYLVTFPTQTALGLTSGYDGNMAFGELKTYKPGDAHHTFIIGNTSTGSSIGVLAATLSSTSFSVTNGHFATGSYAQTVGSQTVAKGAVRLSCNSASSVLGTNSAGPYPDPVTGNLNMSPVVMIEAPGVARGQYPGMWEPQHNQPGSHLDTFTGAEDLAGLNFILLQVYNGSSAGRIAIQTSGSWY